jgi:NCAIR mutase (PurE)-related protein
MLTTFAFGQFRADSMFIYKNFQRRGTTAALWNYHRILDSTNAEKVAVDGNDMKILKDIFSQTKNKRFYQQKHAGQTCYAIVFDGGKKYEFTIESTDNFRRLVNLTTMRSLTVNPADSLNSRRLDSIKKKYWP